MCGQPLGAKQRFRAPAIIAARGKSGPALGGMTKYRKAPQRTHKGPQRSITQDHRGSPIMRELPDLQQFCLIFKKIILFIFCNFVFCVCFFVNFGVLVNYGGL